MFYSSVQALEFYSKFKMSFGELGDIEKKTDSALPPRLPLKDYCGSLIDIHELHKAFYGTSSHPDFKVCRTRLFETSELCEIFFNKWVKYLYLFVVVTFCIFVALAFATVASTAWATNNIIPLNFGPFQRCEHDAFHYHRLPEEPCLYTYYFCLMVFGLIVVPLSLMGLREQAILQTIFGILRVLMISMIVTYSIVKIIEGENICEALTSSNISNHSNSSGSCSIEQNVTNGTIQDLHDIVLPNSSEWRELLVAIPVVSYPFIFQHSVPSFTHPLQQKQRLWLFILCTYGFLGFLFLCLGIVPPLWLRSTTQETITLNWVST